MSLDINDAAVTVIVARRVAAGRDEEFREWNDRLLAAATEFGGYLGSELQPPGASHPHEWVNIYRFEHQTDLDRWLGSEQRARVMADGAQLVSGATREQRIAHPSMASDVVTAVMSKRVKPDRAGDYRRAHDEIENAMNRFAGFLRCDVYEPVPGVQDDHITVFSFDTRAHLDAWLDSTDRQQALRGVDDLLLGENTLNIVGGFGGWFAPRSADAPQRWKGAIAVLIALFPTVVFLRFVQDAMFGDVAWLPALFVSNVVSVSILTWLLMPLVTRVLRGWLRR